MECPRCHTTIGDENSGQACAACGAWLPIADTSDRWEEVTESAARVPASRASGEQAPRRPVSHTGTTGEFLRSLLDVAEARAGRTEPHRSPEAFHAPEVTRLYGDVPRTAAQGATAKATNTAAIGRSGENTDFSHPPPAPSGSLIAQALEWLCARARTSRHGMQSIVDLVCLVASADGEVDEDEHSALTRALELLLGESPRAAVVDMLVNASLEAIARDGADARIEATARALASFDAQEPGFIVAVAVAYASGGLSRAERSVLERFGAACSLSPERVAALIHCVRLEA